jgi:hypothetical protein
MFLQIMYKYIKQQKWSILILSTHCLSVKYFSAYISESEVFEFEHFIHFIKWFTR